MTDEKKKKLKIELLDAMFLLGLVLLGVGIAFAVSWPVALAVVGAILVLVSLWLSIPVSHNGSQG